MLGTLGKREADAGPTTLDERERPIVRRQVWGVMVRSALIAVAAAAIAWII
ncbi:MAG TPA: hypothetical protein VFJ20_02830 [Gemmatimonadaceae bacterium]|nr:hypothetical protein [Gemmatimonadaceae bacterium]